MNLLIDTDAFCKLAVGGVFDDALAVLGADRGACARLPALPYMLRRGRLLRAYGAETCEHFGALAGSLSPMEEPDPAWVEKLISVDDIDPGEAQMFALAATKDCLLVSGDKRALRAVSRIPEFVSALSGRMVVIEAILPELLAQQGEPLLRRRIERLMASDTMVAICFSPTNPSSAEALRSYLSRIMFEIAPLTLWSPRPSEDT